MDINDNEHALMPKLKDIYRKVRIRNSKVGCVLPMAKCVQILHGLVDKDDKREDASLFIG